MSSVEVVLKEEEVSVVDHDLIDRVVFDIQTRISRGEYPMGGWLRQERLARELGVSRTPVREALRQLQVLGTLEVFPNRGARVRLPSARDVAEIFEIRGILEAHAGLQAATLITDAGVRQLEGATAAFRQLASDLEEGRNLEAPDARHRWSEANGQFHDTIHEASGNRHLEEAILNLHRRIPRNLSWLAYKDDPILVRANADEHAHILAAIKSSDGAAASRLLQAHCGHAGALLIQALPSLED